MYDAALRLRDEKFANQIWSDDSLKIEFENYLERLRPTSGAEHGGAGFSHTTARAAPAPRAAAAPAPRAAAPTPFKLPVIIGISRNASIRRNKDGYATLGVMVLSNDINNSSRLLKAMSTYLNSHSSIVVDKFYNTLEHPDTTKKIVYDCFRPIDITAPDHQVLLCIDVFMIVGDDLESTRRAMRISNSAQFYTVDPESAALTNLSFPYSPDRASAIESLFSKGIPIKKLARETGGFLFNLLTEAEQFIQKEPSFKSTMPSSEPPPEPASEPSSSSCTVM